MHDPNELCKKIRTIYPEIGECGGDVDVEFDASQNAYSVELKSGETKLKTYLEPKDANSCMEGEKCVQLGVQVSQLVDNIKRV